MTFGPSGSPDIIAFTIGVNESLDAIIVDAYARSRPFLAIKAIDPTDDFPATLSHSDGQLLAVYLFDEVSLAADIFETGVFRRAICRHISWVRSVWDVV
ncbi:MAG: hypothetical protein ACI8PT_003209 [Gammaproteobacteria bacterium]|jgi:hypothetical protein